MYPDHVQIEMPARYSQADAAWIQEQLLLLPPTLRRKIAQRYSEVYDVEFDAEPVSFRQANRARHEANTRLRQFVRTHGRAIQGYTSEPPLINAPGVNRA